MAKLLGAAGGGLVGSAAGGVAGAVIGSVTIPVVGTITGTMIGASVGAFGGKKVAGKVADKIGLKAPRLQTSEMHLQLDRVKDREITEAVKDVRSDYAGKNSTVTYGSMTVKEIISETTGVSLPVSSLYKMSRMVQEMGLEFKPGKIEKINSVLDLVDEILSDENYLDITSKFDRISVLSNKMDKPLKVSKRGIVNTISFSNTDKKALNNKRNSANKKLGDIRRMLS